MLQLRPTCENCNKPLPNDSEEAMICSFECTFCKDCVEQTLHNVCPNCGGGFERRPIRPTDCFTGNCLDKYPTTEKVIYKPVGLEQFEILREHFEKISPEKR